MFINCLLLFSVTLSLSCANSSEISTHEKLEELPPSLAFMSAQEDPCIPLDRISHSIAFVEQHQFVVRMVGGECKTFKGKKGFKNRRLG